MDFNDDGFLEVAEVQADLPSGATFDVLNEAEKDYIESIGQRYTTDNKFVNASDLQDLDRILIMELMVWRWTHWVSKDEDYFGEPIDDKLRDYIQKYSQEIRLLKANIGIDKKSRDRERGESVAQYIENLGVRAMEFGVMRNEQAVKAITLWRELRALVTLHDNCNAKERKINSCEVEDILDWIRAVGEEFDEIDRKFREGEQKYWIREQ